MATSDVDRHFLDLGVQYYIAARWAVHARLLPVCGSLYHHAIEMFLKAQLSQRYTLKQLGQPPFGHKLPALWEAFKGEFPAAGLDQFDDTIATLDRFERIRYPDETIEKGAQMMVDWHPPAAGAAYGPSSTRSEPMYRIIVTDIDRLVGKIFEVCSRNPAFFTDGLSEYARDAITRDNPVAGFLVKAR